MAKRNAIAKKSVVGTVVVFTFSDGFTLHCDVNHLPQRIREQATLHGIAQKVGDSYAGKDSVDVAKGNATTTWNGMVNGDWSTKTQRTSFMAQAIVNLTGKSLEEATTMLAGLDAKAKAILAKDARIVKEMLRLELVAMEEIEYEGMDLDGLFE